MRNIVLTLVVVLSLPAFAYSKNPIATGDGLRTCRDFLTVAGSAQSEEDRYFQWAQGFMSGMNAMFGPAHTPVKDLASMSAEKQKTAIKDHCAAHPADTYESAVIKLFASLPDAGLQK